MISQYASHNFLIVSISWFSSLGGFSGFVQKQPLASVCKSLYKCYLYNNEDALTHY